MTDNSDYVPPCCRSVLYGEPIEGDRTTCPLGHVWVASTAEHVGTPTWWREHSEPTDSDQSSKGGT